MFSFSNKKLTRKFYERDATIVAKELLGKIFVRKLKDFLLAARIVETEAYKADKDEAAHTFNGKTPRNSVMFNKGGYLYVYFTYGMHYCANVVTGKKDQGDAVLLRGLEPLNHLEILAENRYSNTEISAKEKLNLTNGPAKFCQAFDITKTENGIDLLKNDIFILDNPILKENEIAITERIGIKKSIDFPWRFYIKDNKYVSKR